MKRIDITINGNPIAQKRPRFFRRGAGVGTYNPQEEEAGKWLISAKPQIKEKISGPVQLFLLFHFQRPKSHYGTGKNSDVLKKSAPVYHTTKPDLDNCIKFVKDCLRNTAFDDDSCVVYIDACKSYINGPGQTMITIRGLE